MTDLARDVPPSGPDGEPPQGAPGPAEGHASVMLGGTAVTLLTEDAAVEAILGGCRTRTEPLGVVSANLDHVFHFGTGGRWQHVLESAEGIGWLTLLDGAPLAVEAQRLTGRQWPRLAGSDLIAPLLDRAEADGLRVGFLGGSPEAHGLLRERLAEQRPGLRTAGFWTPDRADLEDAGSARDLALSVAAAGTDVLVVGLGKPRQELWIAEHGRHTGAKALLAFGAVVDFLGERIRRAPAWVSEHGFEWAWRLAHEPARLSERYLVQGPEAYARLRRHSAPEPIRRSPADRTRPARLAVVEARAAHAKHTAVEAPEAPGSFVPPGEHADVAVLVVTYNSVDKVGRLVASLRGEAAHLRIRVVVADNSPDRATLDALARHPDVVRFATGGNLGYAGGINAAAAAAGPAEALLVLNPDTVVLPGAVAAMLSRLRAGAGAVVPLLLADDGGVSRSLRREPSALRTWGEALFGAHFPSRPAWFSETDFHPESYAHAHTVDWATGAAIMVSSEAAAGVGPWDERYFMYSEETDYCHELRARGVEVWFEPAARVRHSGAGSGSSPDLGALLAVNRIRYMRKHHPGGPAAAAAAAVVLREVLRAYDGDHRHTLSVLLRPGRWSRLPGGTGSPAALSEPGAAGGRPGEHPAGCVIIPAHNEEAVIGRTLEGLRPALASGRVEVIVACNACTDRTAEIAASFDGVRVLDLPEPGKAAALNAADAVATAWPRVYLDADIEMPPAALRAVLGELASGRHLAGRPDFRYDTAGCGPLVTAYYRARTRIPANRAALWGAGCYGMTAEGHRLFGAFPADAADDFAVDRAFAAGQKALLGCEPVVVHPPRTAASLVRTLHRVYRAPAPGGSHAPVRTFRQLAGSVRGPLTALDAAVYASFALLGRRQPPQSRVGGMQVWERDESSRR